MTPYDLPNIRERAVRVRANLLAIAKAATGGNWLRQGDWVVSDIRQEQTKIGPLMLSIAKISQPFGVEGSQALANTRHIEAMQPQTAIHLIEDAAELEALRARIETAVADCPECSGRGCVHAEQPTETGIEYLADVDCPRCGWVRALLPPVTTGQS